MCKKKGGTIQRDLKGYDAFYCWEKDMHVTYHIMLLHSEDICRNRMMENTIPKILIKKTPNINITLYTILHFITYQIPKCLRNKHHSLQ